MDKSIHHKLSDLFGSRIMVQKPLLLDPSFAYLIRAFVPESWRCRYCGSRNKNTATRTRCQSCAGSRED